jgi:PTH1 family peptidyl-tRNA hydrolase
MKLIIGLGNPGRQYAETRHNLGFKVLDVLARRWGVSLSRERFAGRFEKCDRPGREATEAVGLLAPMTYMNLSGNSVIEAVSFFKLTPADLLVVADDINLPTAALRIRGEGSPGGHNGLKDIARALGTQAWARLRIGVGPFTGRDSSGFVLGEFRPDERPAVDAAVDRAADAAELWLSRGTDAAANRFNGTGDEPAAKPAKAEKKTERGDRNDRGSKPKTDKTETTGKTNTSDTGRTGEERPGQ